MECERLLGHQALIIHSVFLAAIELEEQSRGSRDGASKLKGDQWSRRHAER